jgi:hypothetical protein
VAAVTVDALESATTLDMIYRGRPFTPDPSA